MMDAGKHRMRRNDRAVESREHTDRIITASTVCRVAMICGGAPYVVPMNFGYDGTALYLHSAREGLKIAALRADPRVCVEFDVPGDLHTAHEACDWSMSYSSVIVHGTAEFLQGAAEKRAGLLHLMRHYARGATYEGHAWEFPDQMLARTEVIRVDITAITGKEHRHA